MRKLLLLSLLFTGLRLAALPAPDFDLTDSDGNQHALYGDYVSQGKLVVIEIFFVNCPPCATHAPHFQTLYTSKKALYPGKVEFMLLTIMNGDHDPQVAQYKINKNMTMPAVSSDGGSLQAVAPYQSGTYGAFLGPPTFVVIAPNSGEVFFDVRGSSAQSTMGKLSQLIDHLLVPAGPINMCGSATPTGAPVDSVRYTVEAPDWDTTFWSGDYNLWNFPELQITQPYLITPYKNDRHDAGISTFDLVLMSKHILGITPFDASWKTTAADVNLSGSVTTFDIVETRKLLLGVYDTFPFCPSWRFVPINGTEVNGYCFPFQCIKMGDVNGSYTASGNAAPAERSGRPIPLNVVDPLLEAGAVYDLNISLREAMRWDGVQLSLGFDPALIELEALESGALDGFGREDFHLRPEGVLTLSWTGNGQASAIPAGRPWLTIRIRALQALRLSDALRLTERPLRAEAYDPEGTARPLDWRWERPEDFCHVNPNPASERFALEFYQETAGRVLIQLIDGRGRIAYAQHDFFENGRQRVVIPCADLPPGLYQVALNGRPAAKVLLRR
ncbi:MAG: redoxin domain-containing protein [Saprospiraceae bacterium]|nr:redoxin domain-containing protein [Saprospiraceae bacterium]